MAEQVRIGYLLESKPLTAEDVEKMWNEKPTEFRARCRECDSENELYFCLEKAGMLYCARDGWERCTGCPQ
jgi:hypothetical protein